ncbi:unnamed protein product [Calicophoron daubneyi]|uniref:C2 domain-containing protein n=1 Tax=Calicophoron daubneyi TaxID=300641 RepID=A0AAV2TSQ3_CALDB
MTHRMDGISNKITPLIQKIFGNPNQDLQRPDQPDDSVNFQSPSKLCTPIVSLRGTNSQEFPSDSSSDGAGRHIPGRFCRQLGRLDPALYLSEETEELYEIPPGHLGRIWFTVSYSKSQELLRVTVLKMRNLRTFSGLHNPSVFGTDQAYANNSDDSTIQDFRVKLFLEQAEKKYQMTSIKKQTTNPNFNEQFCFQVAANGFGQQSLRLDVLGIDKRRRCKIFGYVMFNLSALDTTEEEKEVRVYRDIQPDNEHELSENPFLMVALTYFPVTERLIVGLFECRNLPLKENGLPVDVFAKVVVYRGLQGRELKAKRTEVLGTKESFDESFVFHKIPDPSNVNVRITLMQHGFIDKQLGFIILGNEMVTKGRAVVQWKAMLERPEEQICEWQELQMF